MISLTAAVMAHFGISVRQLARYFKVSPGFVTHLTAGRKGLPAALAPRLLQLSRLLPPPLGQGPPAPAEPPRYRPLMPLPPPEALAAELPGAARPAAEALDRRLADCHGLLLTQGQRLAQLQTSAAALARRHRGLAQLRAAAPPAEPAEAAHYARWLNELAEDLAYDEPNPAATAATRRLLVARLAGLRAEAAALAESLGED